MKQFYSNGKLLITGEYLVLDGAKALAIPTKFGQDLQVEPSSKLGITWNSFTPKNKLWISCFFSFEVLFGNTKRNFSETENRLLQLLQVAKQLNPEFLNASEGIKVTTHLDFPVNWGLGTSSTVINNIATWANVNAYQLLELTFGGSGYDIACAKNNTPICFIKNSDNKWNPFVEPINFNPKFKAHLYFVHVNKKQNSRAAIANYLETKKAISLPIDRINTLTEQIITCATLEDFQELIEQHEAIIGKCINQKPIKQRLFPNFTGSIKSLGAWGGDFILVASKENPTNYFKEKGYSTILKYAEMVL